MKYCDIKLGTSCGNVRLVQRGTTFAAKVQHFSDNNINILVEISVSSHAVLTISKLYNSNSHHYIVRTATVQQSCKERLKTENNNMSTPTAIPYHVNASRPCVDWTFVVKNSPMFLMINSYGSSGLVMANPVRIA